MLKNSGDNGDGQVYTRHDPGGDMAKGGIIKVRYLDRTGMLIAFLVLISIFTAIACFVFANKKQLKVLYVRKVCTMPGGKLRDRLYEPIEKNARTEFFEPLFMAAENTPLTGNALFRHAVFVIAKDEKRFDPAQTAIVKKYLNSTDSAMQERVGDMVLNYMEDQEDLPFIEELLESPDDKVRERIFPALEFLHRFKPEAYKPLIYHLKTDSSAKIRTLAASYMGDPRDSIFVLPLIEALDDESPEVREAAAESLGTLCHPGEEWYKEGTQAENLRRKPVVFLLPLLNDPDKDVRRAAIEALGRIGDKRALKPILLKLKETSDEGDLRIIIDALGDVGDSSTTLVLLPYLKHKDEDVRSATVYVLETTGDRRALKALKEVASNPKEDHWTRENASDCIAKIKRRYPEK